MITEKQLESQIRDLTKYFPVDKYYHPFLSKWSEPGFPDLTIIKVPRLIYAELKGDKGKPTPKQVEWFTLLNKCTSVEAHIWYPDDIEEIALTLQGEK